jgi:dethiobiotin synthetase
MTTSDRAGRLHSQPRTGSTPGRRRGPGGNVIFITGTDTGAGKTVLTALLLCFLRDQGCHALAIKPFCTGDRGDVALLHRCQGGELSWDEINAFYFDEPVAPLVAARRHARYLTLGMACEHVEGIRTRCDYLLVEGCGGLMVPLGEGFLVADWIAALGSPTVVAAANRIGVVNHSLLTVNALQAVGVRRVQVVLMGHGVHDPSCGTNLQLLAELLAPARPCEIPFLGQKTNDYAALSRHSKNLKKVLARVWTSVTVAPL